jgi:hypothetical protein
MITAKQSADVIVAAALLGMPIDALMSWHLKQDFDDPLGLSPDEWHLACQVNLGNHEATVEEDYTYIVMANTLANAGSGPTARGLRRIPILSPKSRIGAEYALSPAMKQWLRNETGCSASDTVILLCARTYPGTNVVSTVTLKATGDVASSGLVEAKIHWAHFMRDCGWSSARKRHLTTKARTNLGLVGKVYPKGETVTRTPTLQALYDQY